MMAAPLFFVISNQGEQTELAIVVNAPKMAGHYILELDMLQEGVSWFGLLGSPTLQLPVRVE